MQIGRHPIPELINRLARRQLIKRAMYHERDALIERVFLHSALKDGRTANHDLIQRESELLKILSRVFNFDNL